MAKVQALKRITLVAMAVILLGTAQAQAQEREPLAMRILLEWTLGGAVLGGSVGFALWLTDPANPNLHLSSQVIEGVALGTVAGSLFALYVMQNTAQFPAGTVDWVPPIPPPGMNSDPIAAMRWRDDLLATAGRSPPVLPLANFWLKF